MLLRIFKNDFKRKKTMNMILLLFIILAAVFVSSGISNLVTVMSGLDDYFDQAGVGDYEILTMGEDSVGCLDEVLAQEPVITDYRIEPIVCAANDVALDADGNVLDAENTIILQSLEAAQLHFFNLENEEITDVEQGHVYVKGAFLEENDLQAGDTIVICHCGTELPLVVDGPAKDAFLGVEMMGVTRFLMNDVDMERLLENEEIYTYYRGEICYIDTEDVSAVSSAISDVGNIYVSVPRATVKMCYVMYMIIVFVMLILSICLMLVSFVVLKFSISVSIAEEYREIGMLKAIGIGNGRIRFLYIAKYFVMGLAGGMVGLAAGFPYGDLMLGAVSRVMVLENENALLLHIIGAALVVALILLFACRCTRIVKKATPVDAIRQGQTGERYRSKSVLKRQKWFGKNAGFLAVNDIFSNPKRYSFVVAAFGICTLFVLMLVNTTQTMKSDKLIATFSTLTDLYITDNAGAMQYRNGGTKQDLEADLDELSAELAGLGMPNRMCVEVQYKYQATVDGEDYLLTFQQGINTSMSDYDFIEGLAPADANEIAITSQISEITGAKIGDVMTIHFDGMDMDCMVTAYFETMNGVGEVVRLYESAPAELTAASALMQYQIDFTDNPSADEIEEKKAVIQEIWDYDLVENATEFCISCLGVVDIMESVQTLLLLITLVVVILVTVLMERSFIAEEKGQIALLKAVGFQDNAVIGWHVLRFGLAALAAAILAGALSIPMTKLCITPIFGMMGASHISYNIRPLYIFAIYPGIVLAVTIAAAYLTALYTKAIKSYDTASVE